MGCKRSCPTRQSLEAAGETDVAAHCNRQATYISLGSTTLGDQCPLDVAQEIIASQAAQADPSIEPPQSA